MITQEVTGREIQCYRAGRLRASLELSENQRRGFKVSRNSPRDEFLPVDLMALLIDWVSALIFRNSETSTSEP